MKPGVETVKLSVIRGKIRTMSTHIPEAAIEAAARAWDKHMGGRYTPHEVDELSDEVRVILEVAKPLLLASLVAEIRTNHDHIVEGGDGYSAGFHYALECVSPNEP